MLRTFLIFGYSGGVTLFALVLILRMRMTHEVNTKMVAGKKTSLFSSGDLDASKLHHQFFPHSHLGATTKASLGVASVVSLVTVVVRLLTL